MRKLLFVISGIVALVALLVGGLVVRGASRGWTPPEVAPVALTPDEGAAQALAAYLRIDTRNPGGAFDEVVDEDGSSQPAWVRFLVDRWVEPLGLRWTRPGGALAIFVDTDDTRPPVVWLSHADVVPVDAPERWTFPPLDGVVDEGFVWGRGALDNKASTVAQLEALRGLLAAGRQPSRDLVLLVTADEETGGEQAAWVASHLDSVGHPEVVIDEGSYILPDFFPGTLVAAVAVAEKTYATYTLTVEGEGRHSSMPTGDSAVDVLVAALGRLSTWETEAGLPPALVEGLQRLSGTRPFPEWIALANADVLESALLPVVQATPAGNAITRDTVAITILDAGVKDNVIPGTARATVNARLLPTTDGDAFLARLQARIADERVVITPGEWGGRAGVGRFDTPTFAAVERAIAAVVPEAVVIPSLTPGTMDARHFGAAGVETLRFHPFVVDAAERARLHGEDERLSVENLERGIRYYTALAEAL